MKFIADNINVDRGARRIIEGVSFSLDEGDGLVVTGENGAGKSTLLRAVSGLLPLGGGQLTLEGLSEGENDPFIIREHIHYLGHLNGMKPSLSVRENLQFWQSFCAGAQGMDIEEALEFVDLPHTIDLPFGYLSTGMKRRISIAKLLVSEKPIWVVDEPTAGLDAQSCEMFAKLAQDFCADKGILIAATHLPLGIKHAKQLKVERLISYHEGDDGFGDDRADHL